MKNIQRGQALITLLFFMIIGITLITAASLVILGNIASTTSSEQGTVAYFDAESGVEDALLLLLRYPPNSASPYTGGTTTYPDGQATVTVSSGSNTITITSVGIYLNATRKVQVQENNTSSGWKITSWNEIN